MQTSMATPWSLQRVQQDPVQQQHRLVVLLSPTQNITLLEISAVISLAGKFTFFLFKHGPSQEAQTKPQYFSFPQAEGVQVSVTQTVSGRDYYALSQTILKLFSYSHVQKCFDLSLLVNSKAAEDH